MRLGNMQAGSGKPPLRTLSEIAEVLGITYQQLMWALKREGEGAPQPRLRSGEAGHCVTGNNKVWYEPREVIRWFRAQPADDGETRREYHREYYRKNYKR